MSLRFPEIPPSQTSVMRVKVDVIETRFGTGRRQRLPRNGAGNVGAEWHLVFSHRPQVEIDRIDAFLTARSGVEVFWWTPPHGTSARFTCSSWQITPATPHLATLQAHFVKETWQS